MSDLLEKCSVCGALVDEEDLFCANCGTEAPHGGETEAKPHTQTSTHNFLCEGCGASMSYDASAQTLRCPFCGSDALSEQKDAKVLAPDRVVPFEVDRERAGAIMREWLGKGFWRPGDLAGAAVLTKIAPVYVPYWVFQARTFTYWTADSNRTPPGARGDWYPMSGDHHGSYSGLLIGASGVLTPSETSNICPFELAKAKVPEEVSTEDVIVEQFRVQRKYARPLARQGLENLERKGCERYVPGRCRNMKVNVRMEGLSSEPMLLPIWVMAYKYNDRVYRFLINGQTERATGQAPISWTKVIVALAIVAIIALVICLGVVGFVAASAGPQRTDLGPVLASGATEQPHQPQAGGLCYIQRSTDRPWLGNGLSVAGVRRKTTKTAICARSACPRWSASAMCTNVCRSSSRQHANATKRWATYSSTAHRVWARPRSPCASRANWV